MSTRINNNNFDKNNIICGCKGIRFCAYCLDSDRIISKNIAKDLSPYNGHKCFIFNPRDRKAHYIPSLFYNSSLVEIYAEINSKSTNHVCTMQCTDELDGVLILEDFISVNEEQSLIEQIDKSEWKFSQSGRLKQDFGPQVNFKQKKIKMDQFKGLPKYTDILLDKINDLNCEKLSGFFPVELCNLDYSPKRLSSIDMHIDDQWIWGERLISINMLSDSLITLQNLETNLLVFLPLYRRSLLCLSGTQRHLWEHSIFAHHVTERRVVITLREAAQGFLEGSEHEEIGRELFNRSQRRIDV